MAAPAMSDSEQLAQHLQRLPQELYDSIYAPTFLSETSTIDVAIDSSYQPPILLQLDRNSRLVFASRYYKDSKFFTNDKRALAKWLLSLPEAHRCLLRFVTCRSNKSDVIGLVVNYSVDTGDITIRPHFQDDLHRAGIEKDIADLVRVERVLEA